MLRRLKLWLKIKLSEAKDKLKSVHSLLRKPSYDKIQSPLEQQNENLLKCKGVLNEKLEESQQLDSKTKTKPSPFKNFQYF